MFCVSQAKGGDQCFRYVSLVVLVTNDQPMKMLLIGNCCKCHINSQEIYMHHINAQEMHMHVPYREYISPPPQPYNIHFGNVVHWSGKKCTISSTRITS